MFRFALFAIVSVAAFGQAPQQAPAPCLQKPAAERPYPKDRLLGVIRVQTPARAEFLIRACGVALAWSDGLVAELKSANASDKVIQAVRDTTGGSKPKVPPPPPPPPPVGPKPGEIRTNSKEGVTYAFIPPGSFNMGCDDPQGCEKNEQPAHKIRITKGFWMAQTEVKTGSYKNYVRAAGIRMPPEPKNGEAAFNPKWANDELPMSMVLWQEAHGYCEWAGMRLPTEAEWEYAARGPAGLVPQELRDVAWFGDNAGRNLMDSGAIQKKEPNNWVLRWMENGNMPHPVGQKAANGWKLHDMLGNLWEWTADWYRENAYATSPVDDPTGPDAGQLHVMRGGSFLNPPNYVRVSRRLIGSLDRRIYTNGFRCAGAAIK